MIKLISTRNSSKNIHNYAKASQCLAISCAQHDTDCLQFEIQDSKRLYYLSVEIMETHEKGVTSENEIIRKWILCDVKELNKNFVTPEQCDCSILTNTCTLQLVHMGV